MMRTITVLTSIFSVFLIIGLQMDQAKAQNEVENIRKVLTLIKDYQKGYDYYRKNTFRNRDTKPVPEYTSMPKQSQMEEQSMALDLDYIRTQGKYGNFSELHSIFVAQILAMVYALKLRERLHSQPIDYRVEYAFVESKTIYYLAKFGTRMERDPIVSAIMKILEEKYPTLCEEFEQITNVFDKFQLKIHKHVFATTHEHEDVKFFKGLHSDAKKLVKYLKTTFLHLNPQSDDIDKPPTRSDSQFEESEKGVKEIDVKDSTGLGIDVDFDLKKLSMDTRPLCKLIVQQDPNKQFINYDDTSNENMFRSTAMILLESLIEKIARANPDIETETVESLKPINSFFQVRPWGEVTKRLHFVEISYIDMKKLYPQAVSDSNRSKSSWIPNFLNFW